MNQLLFERSYGGTRPNLFFRLESARSLRSFRRAPSLRFDGDQGPVGTSDRGYGDVVSPWAHKAGVNALALERFNGRM